MRRWGFVRPEEQYIPGGAGPLPFLDIIAPDHGVDVQVNGDRLHVNVDGTCVLRICQTPYLAVDINGSRKHTFERLGTTFNSPAPEWVESTYSDVERRVLDGEDEVEDRDPPEG